MDDLPHYIPIAFALLVVLSIAWFFFASKSKELLIITIAWAMIQGLIGATGFYTNTEVMPPRIMFLGLFPALIMIVTCAFTAKGRQWLDQMNLQRLTYFHSIRFAVEVVLALLVMHQVISKYMSVEGTNFDVLSGLSAPLVAWIAFRAGKVNRALLLGWNIIACLLLLNVVITAVFAFPTPFQQLAFDQPNLAILHFPFNLLPTVVVPLVFLAHLAAFRQLLNQRNTN